MDSSSKSSKQWICKEWVGKLGFNELDNQYNGFKRQEKEDKLIWAKESRHWHNPRRSILQYISFKCDYKVSSRWLQCFSLDFSPSFSMEGLLHYIVLFEWSWPYTCWSSKPLLECLSHQTPPLRPSVSWGSQGSIV